MEKGGRGEPDRPCDCLGLFRSAVRGLDRGLNMGLRHATMMMADPAVVSHRLMMPHDFVRRFRRACRFWSACRRRGRGGALSRQGRRNQQCGEGSD